MKTSLLTLAAFACSAAFAGGEADPSGQFALPQANATRTQGQPESTGYAQAPGTQPLKTRAQVKAEFLADRDQSLALTGEDSGSVYLAKAANVRHDRGRAG
jgi:curli biogenesis system outer membrane secretion channel CsgG